MITCICAEPQKAWEYTYIKRWINITLNFLHSPRQMSDEYLDFLVANKNWWSQPVPLVRLGQNRSWLAVLPKPVYAKSIFYFLHFKCNSDKGWQLFSATSRIASTTIFRRTTLNGIINHHVRQFSLVAVPPAEGHQGLYRGCSRTKKTCLPLLMEQLTSPSKDINIAFWPSAHPWTKCYSCNPASSMPLMEMLNFLRLFKGRATIFSYRKHLNFNTQVKPDITSPMSPNITSESTFDVSGKGELDHCILVNQTHWVPK